MTRQNVKSSPFRTTLKRVSSKSIQQPRVPVSSMWHEISHNVAREEITEQQSPLTLPNFGFNRKPTNRFHQRFTNSISKYLLLGSNPGVPTVEITSRPRPRVVDNCAFIGFCILDWAVPRATKII